MSGFDPHLIWLDIPPHERPPNYYRLFGLRPLEADANVIAAAAQRVISHVSRYQQSEHAAACAQLLAELTAARDCLLDPMRKQAYDSGFGQGVPGSAPASAERPIVGTPQVPHQTGAGQPAERQITHSPPVPSVPLPNNAAPIAATPPTGHLGEQSLPTSAMPAEPQPITGAPSGVPHAVQPTAVPTGAPQTPAAGETPLAQPVYTQLIAGGTPVVPTAQPTPPEAQPPAWGQGQSTGEVKTVIAGQGTTQPLSGRRTNRSRQMRREQQTQSAYLMVGIAMALVVFFFGAVLLLAIYMGAT